MTQSYCPVCKSSASEAREFLKENIDREKLSEFSYASRKNPEFMCHRLVQCTTCDLIYVEDPVAQEELAEAYHQSDFDSNDEANDAAVTYINAMKSIIAKLPQKGAALEIGTGTGILLDYLKEEGFAKLVGVEPSPAAIAAAPEHRKDWIIENIFVEDDFEPNSFDLICCFMTMEHVRDPQEILAASHRLLRPGGAVVFITHDYRSFANRMLGKRSPIIDIEHMQIFSKASMRYMLEQEGVVDISIESFKNRYNLSYWLRLTPLPNGLKNGLISGLNAISLGKIKIGVNVGNMISSGFRKN